MYVHEHYKITLTYNLVLSRSLPECNFLIQELPEVVPLARQNVECSLPGALQDGRIQLQVHNLFHPQPEATQDITYILRYILQVAFVWFCELE